MAEAKLAGPNKFRTEIQQMMFVSGETAEPTPETTSLVEGIVQQQVVEMLTRATSIAGRRGVKSINTDDLIFLIRHDKAKVSRLRTFLSWKDVRKSAKDSEEKSGGGGGQGDQLDEFDVGGAGGGPDGAGGGGPNGAGGPGAGGPNAGNKPAAVASKTKRAKVRLPWDVTTYYSEQAPERDDEEDEEEEEMATATLQRLKNADERTKNMTPDEYLHWSECRQASFTFRKGKRFREWAGFGVVTDSKPNDDIVDILGFLCFEIVQTLTEEALKVKIAQDASRKDRGANGEDKTAEGGEGGGGGDNGVDDTAASGADATGAGGSETAGAGDNGDDCDDGTTNNGGTKRKRREPGLFDPPEQARTPVGPRHIQEAFRRLQKPDLRAKYMSRVTGINRHKPLKLV